MIVRSLPRAASSKQARVSLRAKALIWIGGTDALAQNLAKILAARGYRTKVIRDFRPSTLTLKLPKKLDGLILAAPDELDAEGGEHFLRTAFELMQFAGPALIENAKTEPTVLVTVTRNGGDFGLTGLRKLADCYAGGLAGLSKTAGHEWPAVKCKAVDLSSNFLSAEMAAESVVDEILLTGIPEIGITADGLTMPTTESAPFEASDGASAQSVLAPDDFVIVTGGARGVTSEIAIEVAARFRPRLLLLGRSGWPKPLPAWLKDTDTEKDIKLALFRQNPTFKPADLAKECQALLNDRELWQTFARLKASGATFAYESCDVRDGVAVKELVQRYVAKWGAVRGIIHGAGVIQDRLILDKTMEQFDLVFATKVKSLGFIMEAVDPNELKLLALFSSSTGRFGRKGQADYAVANEVLNKLAQYYQTILPRCRAVALGWGPWDGGMVDQSLKAVFEKEGVSCIALDAGREYFVRELMATKDASAEIVILAKPQSLAGELHPGTRADLGISGYPARVSCDLFPILNDHRINGRAVVPVALVMEWMAQLGLDFAPGMCFSGISGFQVLNGIKLEGDDEFALEYRRGNPERLQKSLSLPIEIHGRGPDDRSVPCYRGVVHLAQELKAGFASEIKPERDLYGKDSAQVYREALFHGPALWGIDRVQGMSQLGISALVASASEPRSWCRAPGADRWISEPLAIDCAFQLLVLWSQEHWLRPSLPLSFKKYEQNVSEFPRSGLEVRIAILNQTEPKVTANIEFVDTAAKVVVARVQGYEGIATDISAAARKAKSEPVLGGGA